MSKNMPVADTLDLIRTSTFCMCPTGDSKGFSARFYFSILNGCIPVKLDGWRRHLSFNDTAWPFPSLIDWRRVVIEFPVPFQLFAHDAYTMPIISRLLAMPLEEIEARLRYIHRIKHWLAFDDSRLAGAGRDAPAALICELELRLLGTGPVMR
mmetsp:Transcript_6195/g.16270  ORF Transcript_6195/g.16270 Transcript_6195/m.16270 type:complete len:153 (+) Transcript_6195:1038-1496(+)